MLGDTPWEGVRADIFDRPHAGHEFTVISREELSPKMQRRLAKKQEKWD
jgi:hypothetical protein